MSQNAAEYRLRQKKRYNFSHGVDRKIPIHFCDGTHRLPDVAKPEQNGPDSLLHFLAVSDVADIAWRL